MTKLSKLIFHTFQQTGVGPLIKICKILCFVSAAISTGTWDEWGESRAIKVLYPHDWALIEQLPLLLRVDASDFSDIWLNQGLTLTLVFGSDVLEVDSWNATFRIEGPM